MDIGQYSNMDDFGLMHYAARWCDPSLGHFTQADTIVPDGVQGYDRYAYVNNNPVRYNDPTGHQAYQGEGGDYTWEDQMNDAYVTQESEQAKCDAGNYNYCSGVDLIVKRHPKPVSGIHVGYSGQAGYGLEGGVYDQWDFLVDWKEGKLYVVQTVGDFGYVGTPTGMLGEVYVGTSNVHGVPGDVDDISDLLAGPQVDASIEAGLDGVAELGVVKSLSVDIDPATGNPYYSPGAGYMYTTENSIVFGLNQIPNAYEVGLQYGHSESFTMWTVPLWP